MPKVIDLYLCVLRRGFFLCMSNACVNNIYEHSCKKTSSPFADIIEFITFAAERCQSDRMDRTRNPAYAF